MPNLGMRSKQRKGAGMATGASSAYSDAPVGPGSRLQAVPLALNGTPASNSTPRECF